MDLVMPNLDGLGAMRMLRERLPTARVIVLTSFFDDEQLMPALRAGAAGYLLKNAPAAGARAGGARRTRGRGGARPRRRGAADRGPRRVTRSRSIC